MHKIMYSSDTSLSASVCRIPMRYGTNQNQGKVTKTCGLFACACCTTKNLFAC